MSDRDTWRSIPEEIISRGRLDLIDEIFAEDFIEHEELPPGMPAGREGVKTLLGALRQAFPDLKCEVVQQYQDGDIHFGHLRSSGTMTGDFAGMPASGKSAAWDEMHIGRFSGGKVVEHWGIEDQLRMLQQLGFVPPPPGA
jgi:predicted ester cyclase